MGKKPGLEPVVLLYTLHTYIMNIYQRQARENLDEDAPLKVRRQAHGSIFSVHLKTTL